MTKFHWRMVGAFGCIVVIFLGLITYVGRVAPKMARDSAQAVDVFYGRCRARDYEGAHALFSRQLSGSTSTAQLKAEWDRFEKQHGPMTGWKAATDVSISGFGGSVCVFPPFVDFRHGIIGAKGNGTLIYIRMVPEAGKWRVERFNVLRYRQKYP